AAANGTGVGRAAGCECRFRRSRAGHPRSGGCGAQCGGRAHRGHHPNAQRNSRRWCCADGMSTAVVLAARARTRYIAGAARRGALPPDTRAAAAQAIAARPFPVGISADAIVSGFMPLKSEISPIPLMRKLADAGARLALPVVAGRGKPLVMRVFAFGQPLIAGVWGIREPGPDAPEVLPDIVLAPLLAFDRSGYRVGYGAGYYDMTITA